jgi:hypothetical protein
MQIAIAVAVHVKHPRSSMGIAPKVRFALTPRWRKGNSNSRSRFGVDSHPEPLPVPIVAPIPRDGTFFGVRKDAGLAAVKRISNIDQPAR